MKAGDRISVHAPKAYTDDATIATICHPDELPSIEGAPNVAEVRAILAQGSFVAVALIEYKFLDQLLCFAAFQDTHGKWTDLRGTPLIIEPRTAENELDRLLKNQQQRRSEKMRIVSRRSSAEGCGRHGIDWSKF
jgi:hypothetical protein